MSKFIKTIVAVSLVCGPTFTVAAENKSEIIVNDQGFRTVEVAYGDLDLSTAAGQETLSNRVRVAVRKVCGDSSARQSLGELRDYRTCTSKASENAMASLDKETRARLAVNF